MMAMQSDFRVLLFGSAKVDEWMRNAACARQGLSLTQDTDTVQSMYSVFYSTVETLMALFHEVSLNSKRLRNNDPLVVSIE